MGEKVSGLHDSHNSISILVQWFHGNLYVVDHKTLNNNNSNEVDDELTEGLHHQGPYVQYDMIVSAQATHYLL